MYAVILAGGKIGPENKLWAESMGKSKALIEICGKTMVQWVIDALNKADSIEKIIVTGLTDIHSLNSAKPLLHIPDQHGILENLATAAKFILEDSANTEYFLAVSADIPLITAEIIEAVVKENQEPGIDVFYNVVEKKVMNTAFPDVKRTYMRFRDGRFCGADMHVMSTKAIEKLIALGFEQFRKRPFKLIKIAGIDWIFPMIFFPPKLAKAEKVIGQRMGVNGKTIVCRWPEIAMDIDTPEHLATVREKLAQRTSNE